MITAEKINTNFLAWITRLQRYNCYSEAMINDMGDAIKNCSYGLQDSSGAAYQGAMLHVVLNKLCTLAYHINELAFGEDKNTDGPSYIKHPLLQVNREMLMRVLLLQHIAKAEMFITQPNAWKAKNGQYYDFNPNVATKLKCGERSVYLCMKYGIKLTEEEYEAMTIIDKTDENGNVFITPLSMLVKMVNQITNLELRREYLQAQKIKEENNKIEE